MAFADGEYGQVSLIGFNTGSTAGSPVVLCVKKWEADIKKVEHDTSSTCNPTWQSFQTGKKNVEFTLDAQLDLANSPVGTAVNLQADYALVKLYADYRVMTPMFEIAVAVITSIKITSAENDVISYTITGKSSGSVLINGA